MVTSWPYPGSNTVVCSMGAHERCKGNCSCDCHLQSHATGRPFDTRKKPVLTPTDKTGHPGRKRKTV